MAISTRSSSTQAWVEDAPLEVLNKHSCALADGELLVRSNVLQWSILFEKGRLVHAAFSASPYERLYCELRRLSWKVPTLTHTFCHEMGVRLAAQPVNSQPREHFLLEQLATKQILTLEQATAIARLLTREALEALVLIDHVSVLFVPGIHLSSLPTVALEEVLEECLKRQNAWQRLGSYFNSPYQRLYFVGGDPRDLPPLSESVRRLLKGFSLRTIAAALRHDELELAVKLAPYVENKVIHLRTPKPPQDQLPLYARQVTPPASEPSALKTYTIVCIDDSPTVTDELTLCLGARYKVVAINNSVKALTQLVRQKPDLILMDIGMPKLDGYALCQLLRNNPTFKKTPIVMVTGNTGLLNRAKASLSGATDFLSKPFQPQTLLKLVERHLVRVPLD